MVRCVVELRSPSDGTGISEKWSFSGTDGRMIRDLVAKLDLFAVDPPLEVWDMQRLRHRVQSADRWQAAMLLWPDEPSQRQAVSFEDRRAEAAWTAAGAIEFADLLPAEHDLRRAIQERFGGGSADHARQ